MGTCRTRKLGWLLVCVSHLAYGQTSELPVDRAGALVASITQAIGSAGLAPEARSVDLLTRFPVEFEVNQGQHDPEVRFLARARGYEFYLTEAGAIFMLPRIGVGHDARKPEMVYLKFVNGRSSPVIQSLGEAAHRTHYLIGDDPSQFRTDIANFERVVYGDVYPGVDVVFYGQNGRIEYDFILKPGSDLSNIELAFVGARDVRIGSEGDLVVETASGTITQHRPTVFQEVDGKRALVAGGYRSVGTNRFKFEVAAYDRTQPLTIDPILTYSTYMGGTSAETGQAIAVDAAGNAYITGSTSSSNFPTLGAYQGSRAGTTDVFVTKINAAGTGLVYSTYIGGRSSTSSATGIAIDGSGNAYVTGTTTSNTYPTTAGVVQGAISGGGGFVTKLNAAGNTLVYSTYLKGAFPQAIRVDAGGNAFVAGYSLGNLTTTAGAFHTTKPSAASNHSGFVAKLNPTASAQLYSTYLGGTAADDVKGIAVDGAGNAYVAGATTSIDYPVSNAYQATLKGGKDAFVTKLNPSGNALVFSTYIGGTADDSANAVAIDSAGNVYIAGDTFSTDFPRVNGRLKGHNDTVANNAFVTEFAAAGNSLVGSTYFGGAACLTPTISSCFPTQPNDGATAIAVDPTGTYVYVAGYLSSVVTLLKDPIQGALNGTTDAFVAKFYGPTGIFYATRLGGGDIDVANGIAIDANGNAYVVGTSNGGTNFPTTLGAVKLASGGSSDAFVAKIATVGVQLQVLFQSAPATYQMIGKVALNATGSITFFDGATALSSQPVVGGTATFTTTLAIGIHKITALFSGDDSVSDTTVFAIPQQ